MNTERRPVGQAGAFERWIDSLLVHRVTSLVQGAEESRREEILVDARGDPHVGRGEVGAERVGRTVLAAAIEVETEIPNHAFAEHPLAGLLETDTQAGVVGLNAISRQFVQIAELAPHLLLSDESVQVQASPLLLFLALFVAGLGFLAWLILRCVREIAEQPAAPEAR